MQHVLQFVDFFVGFQDVSSFRKLGSRWGVLIFVTKKNLLMLIHLF